MSGQIAADHHFHFKRLTKPTNGYAWIRHGQYPVGDNIFRGLQKLGSDLIQHLSFMGDRPRKHDVECRYTIGSYHCKDVIRNGVYVPYFPPVESCLAPEVKICLV